MQILINGTVRTLPDGATLAAAVTLLGADRPGVAAARNGEVVPRAAWPHTPLASADTVEILTAVQGG